MQCAFFFLCPFFSLLWCHTEQLYPCPHVLLLRIVCCSSNASLSVVEEVHHSGAAGEWFSSSVLQQALVLVMGSSCLYWVRKFWQGVEEERMKASTFYIFKCLNHLRNPASAPPFALFLDDEELRADGVHESVLRSVACVSTSPCVARCSYVLQCWVFWDSLAVDEGEAFLPSLLELTRSSLCLVAQADVEMTD